MAYVKTHDEQVQKFPYSMGDLRKDNPSTSFPSRIPEDMLASYEVFKVLVDHEPTFDEKNYRPLLAETPVFVDGEWRLQWSILEKTEEEKQQYYNGETSRIRSQRDRLLADSDWRVIKAQETNVSMDQTWIDYRQALRDISYHPNFPYLDDEDWPTAPE